jgi:catechol 2,3-dioxygenase-like lactoylglutathione lyase family enzyme
MQGPIFMNLNQVTAPSSNLVRAVAFYQLLGLRLIVDSIPRYVRFECPEGETTFSLHFAEQIPTGDSIVIYFETADLDAEVARLKAEGVVFDTEPTDQTWLWREASLRDPDGNRIILYWAGHNRKNPPWRI